MRNKEMVQKKPFTDASLDNGMAITPKNGVSRTKRSETDDKHWDFLDEIEAPSWVDLTLECQSGYSDKDDEWFHVIHPFHQCSSMHLISAFGHSAEECVNLALDIPEKSSPKLPPSVSKSRGQDNRRSDRVQGNQIVTFNNQHPLKNLNKKSSFVSSESTRVTCSKTSKGRTMEPAGSCSDSRGESSLTENSGQHDIRAVSPSGALKLASSSNFPGKGESSSSSTVTSEGSWQQHQNSFEVSSHAFSQTRGFLSALKLSLRKSCVTRQASRTEVTNGRLSEGKKSSSSKTSVGSSNLHYGGKILTSGDNKDMTPDSRNLRIPVAGNHRVHEANLPYAPGVRPHYTIPNPKLRHQSFKALSINQGKTKVKQQKLHAKVLAPHSVNKHYLPAAAVKIKEKVASSSGQIPGGCKENPAGKVLPSQKSSTMSTMSVQKVTTRVPKKSAKKTFIVPKEGLDDRSKEKKTGTMPEKVYFR